MENTTLLNKEQALIKLCQKDLANFTTIYEWYFKDVFNYIFKCYKDLQKYSQADFEEITANLSDIELENVLDSLIKNEAIGLVKQKYQLLKNAEKEIIHLYLHDELIFKDISALMNMKLSQTKMLYYRAIEKIRRTS